MHIYIFFFPPYIPEVRVLVRDKKKEMHETRRWKYRQEDHWEVRSADRWGRFFCLIGEVVSNIFLSLPILEVAGEDVEDHEWISPGFSNVHRTSGSVFRSVRVASSWSDHFLGVELIVAAGRAVPSRIVGAIIPGWIVGAHGNWIGWTSRHAPRFRIVEREMYGLGLLNLRRVDYAAVRAQRGRWSAATWCIQTILERVNLAVVRNFNKIESWKK